MKFIDLITEQERDTSTLAVSQLLGILKALYYRGGTQSRWNALNGPDGVQRFIRSVRAEAFKRRALISGKHRSWMNTLDPPNCRCGRKGTRIIGSESFCAKCGPTEAAKARKRFWMGKLNRDANETAGEMQLHDSICRRMDAKRINQRALRARAK